MDPIVVVLICAVVIGILAFIVINYKKKKEQQVRSRQTLASDLMKDLETKEEERDTQIRNAKTDDEDYGYSSSNPVIESSVHSSYVFLDRLQTDDGKKITYKRIGAIFCDLNGIPTAIDKYEISTEDGTKLNDLYICAYGHSLNIAPKGLKLV